MKHIIEYILPYVHRVRFGVEADTPDQAIERAQACLDSGAIWDRSPTTPLLVDDFEEDEDAGAALTFSVIRSIGDETAFPEPDASVRHLESNAQAQAASRALVTAYQNGEAKGGSVDWSDIDIAYELALASQG